MPHIKAVKYEEYQAVGVGLQKLGDDDIDKIIAPTSYSKRNKLATTKEGQDIEAIII